MIYRFGPFELDTDRFELRADGVVQPVEPQVFAVLVLLVENRERVVSKDELIDKVWDGRIVSESAISSRIKSARQALGDDGRAQRFIKTLHGRGFRFVAEVRTERSGVGVTDASDRDQVLAPQDGDAPEGSPTTPERPSIAVLPFRRVGEAASGTPVSDALADALPDELVTELSRLRWLFVTSRASSFRLRGRESDPEEVGRVLGVRYCLSGLIELAGRGLVITVELADTRDGGVVWAERFAGAIDDVHALRAEIRARILAALEIRIPIHEATAARSRVSEALDAWSAYHLGLQHMYRFNRRDNVEATALFERAVALDPGFARAHAGLSFVHFQTAFLRHTDDLAAETEQARRFAERGFELDPLDPFVHFVMGRTYWLEGRLDASLPWLERAIALCPNYAHGIYARAWTEALSGHGVDSRNDADLAMRLSPLDPLYYAMQGTRAFGHMVLGEDTAAADWAERAARSPGAHVLIAMIAVAAHALAGDADHAAVWAANVRARTPALGAADFFRSFPMRDETTRARTEDALTRFGF